MADRIAIIPARGGSKRIPRKNIRDFFGKPMIAYSLEVARQSELFDVIHVSTESEEIAGVVEGLGFPVDFMRPDRLADDDTGIMPVLRYVVERYASMGRDFNEVCMLMAAAPLLTPEDLRAASKLFSVCAADEAVLSVASYPAPVEWACELDTGNRLRPVWPENFYRSSHDLREKYYDAGAFAFFSSSQVLASTGNEAGVTFRGYALDRCRAVDIDTMEDWRLAEILYAGNAAMEQGE